MRSKIVFALLFLLVLSPGVLGAANPTELERQIEQVRREREVLLEEQRKLQIELDIVNKESQSIGSAVKSLDTTRKKIASDISVTQSKITSTNLTIRSLESTMSEKEQQIVVHRRAIANMLTSLSEYDTRPLILSLLTSSELSDFWRDRSQLESLNDSLTREIDTLRETRKVLNQEKIEKEKVKEEQTSLKGQLSGQKLVVEENQKAKERLLAETKSKEAAYQKMLADNLARQKESENDLFRLESELKITLDPSLIPDPRRGLLSWPLSDVYITNYFGTNVGNTRIYANGFHNGVDFRATVGTPVKAVLGGVIDGAGNTDEQKGCYSYGRWILINHKNGLSSIYAHLSASLVKKGQEIKTGDIIGYSGGQPRVNGSGYSTGPHLHIGLFATQGVEVRQFTTSIGCKLVSVPIALGLSAYLDPLAYLPAI